MESQYNEEGNRLSFREVMEKFRRSEARGRRGNGSKTSNNLMSGQPSSEAEGYERGSESRDGTKHTLNPFAKSFTPRDFSCFKNSETFNTKSEILSRNSANDFGDANPHAFDTFNAAGDVKSYTCEDLKSNSERNPASVFTQIFEPNAARETQLVGECLELKADDSIEYAIAEDEELLMRPEDITLIKQECVFLTTKEVACNTSVTAIDVELIPIDRRPHKSTDTLIENQEEHSRDISFENSSMNALFNQLDPKIATTTTTYKQLCEILGNNSILNLIRDENSFKKMFLEILNERKEITELLSQIREEIKEQTEQFNQLFLKFADNLQQKRPEESEASKKSKDIDATVEKSSSKCELHMCKKCTNLLEENENGDIPRKPLVRSKCSARTQIFKALREIYEISKDTNFTPMIREENSVEVDPMEASKVTKQPEAKISNESIPQPKADSAAYTADSAVVAPSIPASNIPKNVETELQTDSSRKQTKDDQIKAKKLSGNLMNYKKYKIESVALRDASTSTCCMDHFLKPGKCEESEAGCSGDVNHNNTDTETHETLYHEEREETASSSHRTPNSSKPANDPVQYEKPLRQCHPNLYQRLSKTKHKFPTVENAKKVKEAKKWVYQNLLPPESLVRSKVKKNTLPTRKR